MKHSSLCLIYYLTFIHRIILFTDTEVKNGFSVYQTVGTKPRLDTLLVRNWPKTSRAKPGDCREEKSRYYCECD